MARDNGKCFGKEMRWMGGFRDGQTKRKKNSQ